MLISMLKIEGCRSVPRTYLRFQQKQFANEVSQGKGGDDFFLDPWWLEGPGHEVTINKRLWDLGAELVDNIPSSVEVMWHIL